MENNKKVIDYWDDYDPDDYDPTKRPTSIIQNKTIENKQTIVENKPNDDYETYSYYNEKFNVKQNNVFENNDNYDELDESEFNPTKFIEIDQPTELTDLDELNLNNKNQFVGLNEDNSIEAGLDVNQLYDRWQQSKTNLITKKLDVLRNRVQEPRIEGRRKYSFYVPESLEELLNKPAPVVLDATPHVGGDEYYSNQKYFNNQELLSKVRGKEDNVLSSMNNSNNNISEDIREHITEAPLLSEQEVGDEGLTITNLLKNAKINIATSKKEAIFIDDNALLDPDHLNYEQRLRLLKLASDPNNEERKQLLQMKLNNGNLISLSAIVKERLQKVQNGEIELVEELTPSKNNK